MDLELTHIEEGKSSSVYTGDPGLGEGLYPLKSDIGQVLDEGEGANEMGGRRLSVVEDCRDPSASSRVIHGC